MFVIDITLFEIEDDIPEPSVFPVIPWTWVLVMVKFGYVPPVEIPETGVSEMGVIQPSNLPNVSAYGIALAVGVAVPTGSEPPLLCLSA